MLSSILLSAQILSSDPASFAALRADFDAMKARPEYTLYAAGFHRSTAFPSAAELAGCARLAAGEITVLVELGADGQVTRAVAGGDSAAADCYAAAFAGARFERPRFAPVVMSLVFGK